MDRDLVERARAGDQDAFAELVHQTSDTLFGIARRILRDPELAEDVLQNALVTIWRKLPHLREADRFEGWAFRILVNTCYAEGPSSRRWTAVIRELPLERADHTDDVQAFLDRDELEQAFRKLPLDQRAVFVLHHTWACPWWWSPRRSASRTAPPDRDSTTPPVRSASHSTRRAPSNRSRGSCRHERRPRVPARHDRMARGGLRSHAAQGRRRRPPGHPNDPSRPGSAEPVEAHRHERTRQGLGRRHSRGGDRAGLGQLRPVRQQQDRCRPDSDARPRAPRQRHRSSSNDFAPLDPGRRYAFPSRGTNPGISFTTPAGWTGSAGIPATIASKDYGDAGPVAPLLFPQPFDHGFKDPCTDHTPVVPAAGSGAAGLLAVIADQPGLDAGPITDVTVGGHDGNYVDYTVTTDPATCGNGQDGFWIWGTCPAPVTIGCEDDRRRRPAIRRAR